MPDTISIRSAQADDMAAVFALVQELAEFEKAPHAVETSAEQYRQDGFGPDPAFRCLVAEHPSDGIVGIALYYFGYSTWKGKMLYLDDLVIRAPYRRQGIGRRLVDQLVQVGLAESARLMKWQVLDWNEPAIQMYRSMEATFDGEWIDVKLFRPQMEAWQPVEGP